jgi:DNA-binding transcriptional MerR regulator
MSSDFKELCDKHGIKREYTILGTPQQNGVVERQNRTVQQMARSMMNEKNIGQTYWVEAIHIAVHILNKAHLIPHSDNTHYELWNGRPTSIKHFKVFGSKCYLKNNNENLGKYDYRVDEGIFLGYATNSKGYRCFNKRLHKLVDCIDLKVDEGVPVREVRNIESSTEDTAEAKDEQVQESEGEDSELDTNTQQESNQEIKTKRPSRVIRKNHPEHQIVGHLNQGVRTRKKLNDVSEQSHIALMSFLEPKDFNAANEFDHWVKAMNDELDHIDKKKHLGDGS